MQKPRSPAFVAAPVVARIALASLGPIAACASLAACAGEPPRVPSPSLEQGTPPAREELVLRDEGADLVDVGCSTTAPVRTAPAEFDDLDPSGVTLFHDVLAPYGTWRDDPRLGLVWTPSRDAPDGVGGSFVPYATNGRWSFRRFSGQNEYVWVSDLPWGWVTFHYGRWTYAGDRGWAWIPGRRYAGAWVDWRVPASGASASARAIVGWGPTPPSHLWRIAPGVSRAFDVKEAILTPEPYAAFATPYTYARSRDLFAADLGAHLLYGQAALAVAHTTTPDAAPSPERLGLRDADVRAPPALDRGLQQAWMLATPAAAQAVGAGPELGGAPHLRTWVAGGPRFTASRE